MSHDKRLTLTEYCHQFNLVVIERQQASAVPASYRGKPKDEQVLSGVKNIQEVLLSNEDTVYICVDDEFVFETANSAQSHRSWNHKFKDKTEVIGEHFEVMKEIGAQAEEDRLKTRGKTRKKDDVEVKEPTVDELKAQIAELNIKLEQALAHSREQHEHYAQLAKAHELLKLDYEQLEQGIVPFNLRAKISTLMQGALNDVLNKFESAVAHQAESHKKLDEILES